MTLTVEDLVRRKGVAWNWRCKYLAGIGEQKAAIFDDCLPSSLFASLEGG
jgi:hypothetical protein